MRRLLRPADARLSRAPRPRLRLSMSRRMKPKPLELLNHFTVPVITENTSLSLLLMTYRLFLDGNRGSNCWINRRVFRNDYKNCTAPRTIRDSDQNSHYCFKKELRGQPWQHRRSGW